MRARTVGRWAVVIVLVVLSAMVLPASVALADQADKVSDDGVDYGWLYRRGNMWYDKETDVVVLAEDEYGIFYTYTKNIFGGPNNFSRHLDFLSHSDRWPVGNYAQAVRLQRTYYEDGTLFYSAWGRECLDAVVASGRIERYGAENYQNTSDCLSGSRRERSRVNSNERVQKGKRSEIRRVVIDPSAFDTQYFSDNLLNLYIADEETREYIRNWNYLPARYTESWFNGCVNLREVVGLENIRTDSIVNMARMFAGCPQLESLDLSTFDTSACANFAEMFDGCESLCELRTGDGWTQEHVGEKVHNEQSYNSRYPPPDPDYARFPMDMVRQEDGEQFAAGDVVTGTKSVIGAIEEGREAASAIDLYLGGDGDISAELLDPEEPAKE
ncbi:MAG: BspA family leucine-rich repeat surface protein, partial [Atopobiaceae bacterium]|nr:BspA family leucine-rich repeat surface protein [Atopobiaceae bacterium]